MSVRCAATLLVALGLSGCSDPGPEFDLLIRESSDRRAFGGIATLRLSAKRDDRVLAERDYPPTASYVTVSGVSYGSRTVFALSGITAAGDVIAHGATCPFDFNAPDVAGPRSASLFFAATNSFARTLGSPQATRNDPAVWSRDDGDVMVAGGLVGGTSIGDSERFSVSSSAFSVDSTAGLRVARQRGELTIVPDIGVLVSGGLSAANLPLGTAELYRNATGVFELVENTALAPRVGHRAVTLASDRILLTGGRSTGGVTLASTAVVSIQTDGSATVSVGPPMVHARSDHSAVVASGVSVLIGGYGSDGVPLSSIEALVPSESSTRGDFVEIAFLRKARADASGTVLLDGTILIVGGAGDASGSPLSDAEVYNPITEQTTVYSLATARRGHTATPLANGRILVIGGIGSNGAPLSSVELFIPGVGFVSERPLNDARSGHRAVTLCDGTVLVVGGGAGAEVYVPPL